MGPKKELATAPFARILHLYAERVSPKAAREMAALMEELSKKIAEKAAAIAKSSGRKTIVAEDVKLAAPM
ncbi:MAG: NFYB/HAP3 family transcription factor subunit [Euryarchaeota archaeon]|nr:NFYB/HAP3 family transcription factor subunit [Euryarchaeota archaeon]